jgi:outer membrane protein OmpA-like peptidoglycan-associated protein
VRRRRPLAGLAAALLSGVMLSGCGYLSGLFGDGPDKVVAQAPAEDAAGATAGAGADLDPRVIDALRGAPTTPEAATLPGPIRPPEPTPRPATPPTRPPAAPAVEREPLPEPTPTPLPTGDAEAGPERPGLPPPQPETAERPAAPPSPPTRPPEAAPTGPDAPSAAEPIEAPEPEILADRPPTPPPADAEPPEGRRIEAEDGSAGMPETDAGEPAVGADGDGDGDGDGATGDTGAAAEASAPPDEEPQLAARPPDNGLPPPGESVTTLPDGDGFRIVFDPESQELTNAAGSLLAGLSERMTNDQDLRLQVRAYAGGTPESASQARRLSLARALRVRTFLVDRGIRSTRIDVRALGNTAAEPPADRVDLLLSP